MAFAILLIGIGCWLIILFLIELSHEKTIKRSFLPTLASTFTKLGGWKIAALAIVLLYLGVGFLGSVERGTMGTKHIDSYYCSLIAVGKARCDDLPEVETPPSEKSVPNTEGSVDNIPGNERYFGGYRCTVDCTGHEAGYKWAMKEELDYEDDCPQNSSASFEEGCMAYIEEQEEIHVEEEHDRFDFRN